MFYTVLTDLRTLSPILQGFIKDVYSQVSQCFDIIFSKYQCEFKKGYRVQSFLLSMNDKKLTNTR